MGKWIHSIKAIFLISVLSVVGIVFSIQFIASIVQFRHSLEANVNDTMKSKAGELENQIAGQLKQVGKYTELLAYTMESIPQQNPDIILSTIERFIPSNKLIVGAGMRTGAEQVQQGGQAVRSVGAAFEFISATVAEVAGQIKDVSAAVNNMGVSTNDIIGFMKSIDEESDQLSLEASAVSAAAEQQAAAMDEVKNASLALAHMAEELDENIRQFRLS